MIKSRVPSFSSKRQKISFVLVMLLSQLIPIFQMSLLLLSREDQTVICMNRRLSTVALILNFNLKKMLTQKLPIAVLNIFTPMMKMSYLLWRFLPYLPWANSLMIIVGRSKTGNRVEKHIQNIFQKLKIAFFTVDLKCSLQLLTNLRSKSYHHI